MTTKPYRECVTGADPWQLFDLPVEVLQPRLFELEVNPEMGVKP